MTLPHQWEHDQWGHQKSLSSGGSACASTVGAGGHHRVDTLWEELRWLTVHGHLLVPVRNLNKCGLVERTSSNLQGGWSSQSGVKSLKQIYTR